MKSKPYEIVSKKTKDKVEYRYHDKINDINIISRVVCPKKDITIHYPFNNKNGGQLYKNIKTIEFRGFKGIIPVGFKKQPYNGYGFTGELSPVLYCIEKFLPKINKIIIDKKGKKNFINGSTIGFVYDDLILARPLIVAISETYRKDREHIALNLLSTLFPDLINAPSNVYPKGALHLLVEKYSLNANKLSDNDKKALGDLFLDMTETTSVDFKSSNVIEIKEKLDKVITKNLVGDFEKLLNRKNETGRLEDAWQDFFNQNILYLNFGYVEKFDKLRIQGDKSLNIPDFLLLNYLGYIDVFEIKTHLTNLLCFDKGRKNFYWSSEAAKAIIQAENYIDSLICEEKTIITNIRDEYQVQINVVRPYVYIIASSLSNLIKSPPAKRVDKVKLEKDFRRLNSSLKNIKFILYDELLNSFKQFIDRLA